jgi:hypothetical protein
MPLPSVQPDDVRLVCLFVASLTNTARFGTKLCSFDRAFAILSRWFGEWAFQERNGEIKQILGSSFVRVLVCGMPDKVRQWMACKRIGSGDGIG